ncbi:hypothetical protein R1sor_019904 [Riccia sorocarpa]|uniref:Uncharacterized protein n=1 Tax=Riccia sorocarpa TaxID=122646 RepID=A0ABD3IE03_9MARC
MAWNFCNSAFSFRSASGVTWNSTTQRPCSNSIAFAKFSFIGERQCKREEYEGHPKAEFPMPIAPTPLPLGTGRSHLASWLENVFLARSSQVGVETELQSELLRLLMRRFQLRATPCRFQRCDSSLHVLEACHFHKNLLSRLQPSEDVHCGPLLQDDIRGCANDASNTIDPAPAAPEDEPSPVGTIASADEAFRSSRPRFHGLSRDLLARLKSTSRRRMALAYKSFMKVKKKLVARVGLQYTPPANLFGIVYLPCVGHDVFYLLTYAVNH